MSTYRVGDYVRALIDQVTGKVVGWRTPADTDQLFVDAEDLAASSGSSLVGHIASGTGAVARTVQSKARDIVSVKDFGATGNGSTSDRDAILAAVSSLDVNGGEIYFPAGDYRCADEFGITKNNVRFTGAGRFATRIVSTATDKKILNITGIRFTLDNMAVGYAAAGVSGGTAVYLSTAYAYLHNFYIFNGYVGVHVDTGSNSNKLHMGVIEDSVQIGIYGFNSANTIVSQVFLLSATTTAHATQGAIRLQDGIEGWDFSQVEIYQGVYSMITEATVNARPFRPMFNKFVNCFFDSAANGVLINNSAEFDFVGCWFSARPENGVVLGTCDGIHFTGGGAIGCGKNGVYVNTGAKAVSFVNFQARSNSWLTADTYDGIVFDNATDWEVIGGYYDSAIAALGAQRYGIRITAGCDNFTIAGANVRNNTTAGILDGSADSAEKEIRAVGYRTVNSGAATILNGASAVTITHGLAATPRQQDITVSFSENSVTNGVTSLFVDTIGATTFQINSNAAATGDLDVTWSVRIKGA